MNVSGLEDEIILLLIIYNIFKYLKVFVLFRAQKKFRSELSNSGETGCDILCDRFPPFRFPIFIDSLNYNFYQ